MFKGRTKEIRAKKMRDNERWLVELLSGIDDDYENLLIVVEGKRDERVLRSLGIRAPIIRTQRGSSRTELVEEIAKQAGSEGNILILTDFDKKGVELCRFIEKELEPRKISVLKRLRSEVRKAMGNWRCIEELISVFKRGDSPEPVDEGSD